MSEAPYKLLLGDCREAMKTLSDNSVDAIVTDPPYELGFMGKAWDASGIAYDKAVWTEALRVLKPGGHLLAFSGSRTYHRMVCAIEDSGFEIRDQMMWIYGSGFPKSLNVAKAIDATIRCGGSNTRKLKQTEQETGGESYQMKGRNNGILGEDKVWDRKKWEPTTDEAKQYEGWGTALKPAHEPIVVARKPLDGTVAENFLKWGVGGVNIDGCRIAYESAEDKDKAHYNALGMERLKMEEGEKLGSFEGGWKKHKPELPEGRWPANVMHDGSQQVLDLFPESNSGWIGNPNSPKKGGKMFGGGEGEQVAKPEYRDAGSAARFFYCPKASKSDKEAGLDGFEEKKPVFNGQSGESSEFAEGSVEDKFTTAPRKNFHPTVKPTELMRYLCRLVTPKGGLVLDPFNGSGSTGKAAMLEGYRYVGIDMSPEYIAIAEARIKATLSQV